MSAYHPLSEQEAIQIALSLDGYFPEGASLTSREIGDGNLNLVFHIVDSSSGKSLIMKQALPYAKVVGESWPLTLDRARIESDKLILEGELAPGLVPNVYKYDPELYLTIMEDLSDHIIMRQGLIGGTRYPKFADDISTFMARTLFFTSDLGMNQQEKKQRVKAFINPELCKITEDLIFDDPYTNSPNNSFDPAIQDAAEALWQDSQLHLEVSILRDKFLTNAQALLHGDLHTGSVFVTPESTKVIDPEFAYYGPIGFDIGAVIANLLLNFAGQEHWSTDTETRNDFRRYLTDSVRDVWNLFDQKFRALWDEHGLDRIASSTPGYQDYYMNRLLQDAVGFAGCKIVRRIVGLSHVIDVDRIPDAAAKEKAQRLALAIGTSLIRNNRNTQSIEEVIDVALSLANK
ncbi:S-methyl-5-thioribose kinase [Paenibacillus sp. FSL A5-0031]|uniref:S-methyl-5-thioribose kinase n=1 Tax=Paenibacillus sp. FSL A5-0031 TaxID=1920420 RepID=UPI00096C901E|nr:S-methyl-5-thioribose kinase [Paenibacillus sp. FSL A5-0031]OME78011.1 S-methyl-5-thioribose kinase [Paenibacillus sp. FSL A5-0031]